MELAMTEKNKIQNQRGSVVIFLAALPVILALMTGAVVAGVFAYQISSTQNRCFDLLHDLQTRQLRLHRKLLAMNAEARSLRLLRARADAAVQATIPNPQAHAAARAAQLAVISKQLEFRTRQTLLHTEIIADGKLGSYSVKNRLSAASLEVFLVKTPSSPFKSSPAASLSPDKVYVQNAEDLQRVGIGWALSNPLGRAKELIQIAGAANNIHGTCNVSIAKKGGRWVPVISEDKS